MMVDLWIAVILALRTALPGLAWAWAGPRTSKADTKWKSMAMLVAYAWFAGVTWNTLIAVFLGHLGIYTLAMELTALAAVTVAGLYLGLRGRRDVRRDIFKAAPLALIALWAILLICLRLPDRGQWLFGGWDPGIYFNEGIVLAQQETFHPDDAFLYEQFDQEERELFVRRIVNRVERFPGVLTHADTRRMGFQFFRFTPAWLGVLHRVGGLNAAARGNLFLAALTVALFAVFLLRESNIYLAACGAIFLLLQPIFLYHTHVPVSEMAHLFLLIGLFLFIPGRTIRRGVYPLSIILFCIMLNRFSFLPFGALLLIVLAWFDRGRTDRKHVLVEHLFFASALICGGLADLWMAPTSMLGWTVFPVLLAVSATFAGLAFMIDLAAVKIRANALLGRVSNVMPLALTVIAVLAVTVCWGMGRHHPGADELDNVYHLVGYTGIGMTLLASIGALCLAARRRALSPTLLLFAVYLAGITAIILYRKNVVDWYPWATRRHLAYTVPLIAMLCGFIPAWFLRPRPTNTMRLALAIVGLLLCAAAIAPSLKNARAGWTLVEGRGVDNALQTIAAQVETDDIVIAAQPRWGTPLALTYDRQVLDGRPLWRGEPVDRATAALSTFHRLAKEGYRIKFLNTAANPEDDTMGVYPVHIPAKLIWASDAVTYETIIQHPKLTEYALRGKTIYFQLYAFTPSAD
jgi:hypothetical protein